MNNEFDGFMATGCRVYAFALKDFGRPPNKIEWFFACSFFMFIIYGFVSVYLEG